MDPGTKRQLLVNFLAPVGVLLLGMLLFIGHVERQQHYAMCHSKCTKAGARFARDFAFPPFVVPECRCVPATSTR